MRLLGLVPLCPEGSKQIITSKPLSVITGQMLCTWDLQSTWSDEEKEGWETGATHKGGDDELHLQVSWWDRQSVMGPKEEFFRCPLVFYKREIRLSIESHQRGCLYPLKHTENVKLCYFFNYLPLLLPPPPVTQGWNHGDKWLPCLLLIVEKACIS